MMAQGQPMATGHFTGPGPHLPEFMVAPLHWVKPLQGEVGVRPPKQGQLGGSAVTPQASRAARGAFTGSLTALCPLGELSVPAARLPAGPEPYIPKQAG